jgi:hypothetical protein
VRLLLSDEEPVHNLGAAPQFPGYYEELAAARAGTATTVPVTDAIPDWAERAAGARDHR